MLEQIPLLQASGGVSSAPMFFFVHSLLRWLVLLAVAFAGLIALRGWIMKRPIIVWERTVAIVALTLCHVQLLVGLILYALRFKRYVAPGFSAREIIFWKYEHVATMVLAVILVTLGRVLSKRANTENAKWKYIAIFYLLGLALMCWAIPWPHTQFGLKRGWI